MNQSVEYNRIDKSDTHSPSSATRALNLILRSAGPSPNKPTEGGRHGVRGQRNGRHFTLTNRLFKLPQTNLDLRVVSWHNSGTDLELEEVKI